MKLVTVNAARQFFISPPTSLKSLLFIPLFSLHSDVDYLKLFWSFICKTSYPPCSYQKGVKF